MLITRSIKGTPISVQAAASHIHGASSLLGTNKIEVPFERVETLHIWAQTETSSGLSARELVPSWLLNSIAFDAKAFKGRLENFRAIMRTTYEGIWPGQRVHAVFDVELLALGALSVTGDSDAVAQAVKAEHQRDTLLAALKALLQHEGTVVFTGIGELPSDELEEARRQAHKAIDEVERI